MADPKVEPGVNGGRRLLNAVLGAGVLAFLGSVFYPVIRYVIPPKETEATPSSVVAAKVNDLGPNQGKIFRFGNRPGLLVRLPTGEYRAFSAVCTHLHCTVQYRPDLKEIWCPCHNGKYNLNGEVLSGPPPAPLTRYKVAIRKDEIVVMKG